MLMRKIEDYHLLILCNVHFCIYRFKYERTGQLRDESHPPNILQSVHQLLEVSTISE